MCVDEKGDVLLQLGVFAAHNLEEISHLSRDLERLPEWVKERGPWAEAPSFAIATGLLTAVVSASSLVGLRASGLRHVVLVGGPSAALVGNALSHVARALVQRRYNGGLATAPAMGLIAARVFASSTQWTSASVRRNTFLLGNLAAVPAIVGSLRAGRFLRAVCVPSVDFNPNKK